MRTGRGRKPPGREESMKPYTVAYKMHQAAETENYYILANNKEEAWEKATFEAIPEKEGATPYSSWVAAVTYQNGTYKTFNTFEGKPY